MRFGLPCIDPFSSPHHAMADIAKKIAFHTTDDYIRGLAMRQLNIVDVANRYVEPSASAPAAGEAVQVLAMDVPRSSREARRPQRIRIVDPGGNMLLLDFYA
ncbi:hypothetical protein Fmac_009689 [Flemingia macrophylla]|uniref:Uncharacterized protein n=1 Tax=Flemingia macrophylla TaxID=520843 RepID=A0ABD1N0X8_9FABA